MQIHRRVLKHWVVLCGVWVVYAASYAPFIRYHQGDTPWSAYRAPGFYRPVEWFTVQTECWGSPLVKWARLWGVEDNATMQAWFYAQGVDSEDINEFDIAIQ